MLAILLYVNEPVFLGIQLIWRITAREDAWRLRRLVMMEEGKKKKGKEQEGSESDDDLHSGLDSFKTVGRNPIRAASLTHDPVFRYNILPKTPKPVAM